MRPCPASAPERHCACMAASADIEVQNLARRYGRRWALADVSFKLAGGAVLMLGGPNGSGKSTLLRTIATAVRPDGGSARIGGFDVVTDVGRELKAGGTTVIFATHQLARAAASADEALLLEAGRVAWRGKAAEAPV